MLLTSVSRIAPHEAEAVSVANEQHCLRIARRYGEHSLPTKHPVWDNAFSSASPLGALTPTVARETLTRKAQQKKTERQKRLRSGVTGLFASLHPLSPRPLRRGVVVSAA